jgi:hypothetical protein
MACSNGELVRIGDPIYEVGENKSAKEQRLARKTHMPSWAVLPYRACQSHELDFETETKSAGLHRMTNAGPLRIIRPD